MKTRINQIRTNEGLSMQSFAERLNLSKGAISLWESGDRNVPEKMIKVICKEFDINETWLRTGEGEMKAPQTRTQEIAAITADLYKADPEGIKYKMMKALSELSPDQWRKIKDFIDNL